MIRAQVNLSGHSRSVLETLLADPKNARPSDLSERTGLSREHLRDVCNRLERRGIIRKVPLHYEVCAEALK